MNHSQVAHVWANQSKAKAKGCNLFFDGPTIYSYGRHFPIATHVKNKQGQPAVIFTRDSSSVSTAKHTSYVHRALSGLSLPVFYGEPAPGWGSDPTDKARLRKSFAQYIADAKKVAIKAKRATKYGDTYARQAQELLSEAAKLNAFFRLGMKLPAGELITDEELAKMKKKAAEATARQRKLNAKRDAERAADAAKSDSERLAEWQAGERSSLPWNMQSDENASAYLRIKGDEVQTSRGAQVPLEHAKRVFRFVKACKERGQEWHRNGSQVRIGHFNLDEVSAEGNIRAGCHFLTWQRIAECAQAGGFFGESASEEAVEDSAAA